MSQAGEEEVWFGCEVSVPVRPAELSPPSRPLGWRDAATLHPLTPLTVLQAGPGHVLVLQVVREAGCEVCLTRQVGPGL